MMLGAALGGLITSSLGVTVDFIFDSFSYLLSAIFLFRLVSTLKVNYIRNLNRTSKKS